MIFAEALPEQGKVNAKVKEGMEEQSGPGTVFAFLTTAVKMTRERLGTLDN